MTQPLHPEDRSSALRSLREPAGPEPAVIVVASSATRRASLAALARAAGFDVRDERPRVADVVPDGSELLVVSGADEIESAFELAGTDGRLAVVGFVEDAHAALRLVPDADVPGWALLPEDATAQELRAAVAAAAAGLGVWPASWSGVINSATPRDASLENGGGPLDEDGVSRAGEPLTAREQDVLELLAQGLSNRQMAERLRISEHTVKFHVASIYGKLGVSGRAAAVRRALRRGLIEI
ncbi:MAG TPA: helix-turn-helix transcriptional regulator [Vicinamibacterales bacterium]